MKGYSFVQETARRWGISIRWVNQYALEGRALLFRHCREIEAKTAAYEARLRAMYASDGFKAHSVYPTTNAVHVYAVIAMCLELKAFGLTDTEIIETINHGFVRRRSFFRRIMLWLTQYRAVGNTRNGLSISPLRYPSVRNRM